MNNSIRHDLESKLKRSLSVSFHGSTTAVISASVQHVCKEEATFPIKIILSSGKIMRKGIVNGIRASTCSLSSAELADILGEKTVVGEWRETMAKAAGDQVWEAVITHSQAHVPQCVLPAE